MEMSWHDNATHNIFMHINENSICIAHNWMKKICLRKAASTAIDAAAAKRKKKAENFSFIDY